LLVSEGVKVAVIVAVPGATTVATDPVTDATEAFDDEYANEPATLAVGAVSPNAASP
jgi:hypothetical protein